jgi:ABC-type Fe3+ transport system substrate-binding protein
MSFLFPIKEDEMTIMQSLKSGLFTALVLVCVLFGYAGSMQASELNPLAQIIEGAKKEGSVSVTLKSSFTPRSMERLKKEIKDRFGVNLEITFAPSSSFPKEFAQALMEKKVGATNSYDLMTFNAKFARDGFKEGLFEKFDWKPLLLKGTPPDVMIGMPPQLKDLYGLGLTYYTTHKGIIYNPEKISTDKVPKNIADLADPKWKGKLGVANYTSGWAELAFLRGKEKTFSELRAIMKNKPVQGRYVDLLNRYLLGEISIQYSISGWIKDIKDKGMPAAWQSFDFSDVAQYQVILRKGARHPNAAKLLAIYIASPEGAKFTLEEGAAGNRYYPGNYEHDIKLQDEKQGFKTIVKESQIELMQFMDSKESDLWEKEIKLIFETGG